MNLDRFKLYLATGEISPDAASTLDADPITRYLAQVEKDKGNGC